jgi:hypothetical protein
MMPRVIQTGGGSGKMRVRYTARRKRGLVATSKNMMAEGMALHAAKSDLHVTPPAEKLIQNPLRKQSSHVIPRPFQPKPRRTLIDCHVVCAGNRADRSI